MKYIGSFKKFLLEMPARAGDIYNLSSYKDAIQKYISEISNEKPKLLPCNIDGISSYSLSKKYIVFYNDSKIISFIKYTKKSGSMFVEQIENLSDITGLSLKMYVFILKNKLFKDIETGDILSDKNVSAHKSMVGKTSPFRMFIRDLETLKGTPIISPSDIDREMTKDDMGKVFVLKENFGMIKVLSERLDCSEQRIIDEMITRLTNGTI